MDNSRSKDELDDNIMPVEMLPPANKTAPLSNRYQIAAISDNTRRAYQADIRHYETWGGQLPATTEAILRFACICRYS
jgi:hypothetical protein